MKRRNGRASSSLENHEVVMVREFDAPQDKVLHALNDPEICEAWGLGPAAVPMTTMNFKHESGRCFPLERKSGNKSITQLIELSDLPRKGHGALEKIIFEEIVPEKTTVTMVLHCESVATCGGWMESGIGDMMAVSFLKLDELLREQ